MLQATPVESIAPDSSTVRSTADWRGHYRRLGIVVARRDASVEPLDMIPRREAEQRCAAEADRLDEANRAICREWADTRSPPPSD
jgi:hypothetical protein